MLVIIIVIIIDDIITITTTTTTTTTATATTTTTTTIIISMIMMVSLVRPGVCVMDGVLVQRMIYSTVAKDAANPISLIKQVLNAVENK